MDYKDIQFISCSKCGGASSENPKKPCYECSGLGVGTFFKGKFLYWDLEFNKSLILFRKIEKILNFLVNIFAIFLSVIGLISLIYWYAQYGDIYYIESLYFWQHKSVLILLFWIGLISNMFLLYRYAENRIGKVKIKKELFTEAAINVSNLPNNWKELRTYRNKLNIAKALGSDSLKILERSFLLARKYKSDLISPEHIFLSILRTNEAIALFSRLNIPVKEIERKVKNFINSKTGDGRRGKATKILFSTSSKEALILAYINSFLNGQQDIKILDLIAPVIEKDKNLIEILYDFEIDVNKVKNVIEWFRVNDKIVEAYKLYKKMSRFKPGTNMDRAYTALETPILNHFSYDLTLAAKSGKLDFCVAREKEIKNIFENFESGNNGAVLVGPVGVGKRTVIYGIAERMVSEDVPQILKDKRLLELDLGRLISGADASKAQERLSVVIDEIIKSKNIVLFIDNIENIAGISAGEEESLELVEILANAIERKEIYCLGIATSKNYTKYLEGKPIGNVMTKIDIDEPEGDKAIQIVQSKISVIESKYKIYFSYQAIERAVKLSKKYMHDQYLPEKAIKILESAAVDVSKRCKKDSDKCICTHEDVSKIISELTSIPTERVSEDESKVLLNLEERIHKRMINQVEAVKMVSDSLRRARAELREGKRPIASFLFMGPTGVGKTELAKSVSEVYFGGEDYMIRIDMSEYQHADSVTKMIGDESGTLGYLTEAVRKKPFSLILLDEFEKAHPHILNLFLQVMDDGRLTDGQGRTIDFTNSIIIATSNAGAVYIQEQIRNNKNILEIKGVLIEEHLSKVMKPELINRFDGVVVFTPLKEEDIIAIAKLMLNKIKKLLEAKGVNLDVSEEAIVKLAHEGYDPKFGARPMRRLLQDKVENVIANKMLTREIERRDTVIINQNAEIEIKKAKTL